MQSKKRISASMSAQLRFSIAASFIWILLGMAISTFASAQASTQEGSQGIDGTPALAAPVVPQQVRYAGTLANRAGDTVEAVFRIYAAQQGGEPLWTETQRVAVGEDGAYVVLLGAASPNGLPQTVFAGGLARWLGISAEQSPELDRVLLASVPYAMKSADAEALAGHAASDFVTREQLTRLTTQSALPASNVQPDTSGTVTGSGTAGTVPLWTGTLTQANSKIVQVGSDIGINEATPGSTLDVNGTATIRGATTIEGATTIKNTTTLPAGAPATTGSGYGSQLLDFSASAWSSTAHAPVDQTFRLFSYFTGNNTATPSGTLNLQFQEGTGAVENVLSIASNGVINFSPEQTFPIKGTGGGTITGITTSSPLTGSGTTGSVALGLNQSLLLHDITPSLEYDFNAVYAQLGSANTFTTGQTFQAASSIGGTNNESGPMLSVSNSGGSSSSAINASNGGMFGTGIYASAAAGGYGIAAYGSQSNSGIGILGVMAFNPGETSSTFELINDTYGYDAGVWADGPSEADSALIATADYAVSGTFFNNSSANPTIRVQNDSSGGPTGLVERRIDSVIRASGPGGMCGINQTGNLACTGQMKAVVAAKNSARQLETYTVQSAENWLEDYGSGELSHGSATIQVDREFAETVNTGVEFHVFLTPGGDCKGLYVTNKTPSSFEVHELGGGTSSIPFDYKIVAKRNGLEGQRLVDVTEQMRIEAEAARPKPLAHPLPGNRGTRTQHAAAGNAAAAIKR